MTDKHSDQAGQIETHCLGSPGGTGPSIVFLHEGLGSVSTWRDFPARLCLASGLPGLVYSRHGYGRSAPMTEALTPDFMHQAASEELPAVLGRFGIERPILLGHSDGASIAIIHAASAGPAVRGVIAIAPHLFVEPIALTAIDALARRILAIPSRLDALREHHQYARVLFDRWTSAWLSPAFENWNIEADAAAIKCPVLAIQGEHDQYGTLDQIDSLSQLAQHCERIVLPDCKHNPHLECADLLLEHCLRFISRI